MSEAVVGGIATVVVALIGLGGAWLDRRQARRMAVVHEDNRNDHAATAKLVAQIAVDMTEVKSDVRDVKADVRDLKAADRVLTQRLDEHIAEQPPRRTA